MDKAMIQEIEEKIATLNLAPTIKEEQKRDTKDYDEEKIATLLTPFYRITKKVQKHRDFWRYENLEEEKDKWYTVYAITNLTNNKKYIGQAVSHMKVKGNFEPHGYEGRFKSHLREAASNKKHQSRYLNNAIRADGKENFKVDLLFECEKKDVDLLERLCITKLNTQYPNGYNIMKGGRKIEGYVEKEEGVPRKSVSDEERLNQSLRTAAFNHKKKIDKVLSKFNEPFVGSYDDYLVFRKDRDGNDRYSLKLSKDCVVMFGGHHITEEESIIKAELFFNEIQRLLAKHLGAGSSLESEDTTDSE